MFYSASSFHLNLKPNGLAPGFLPLRIINADLKYLIVFGCMSLFTGILFVYFHLSGNCKKLPRSLLCFGGIFLLSVLFLIISHNPMRAWSVVFALAYCSRIFVLCLSQLRWSRGLSHFGGRIINCRWGCFLLGDLGSALPLDGLESRLVRTGYSGIIYNHNFAAEYHAPLIPLTLGVILLSEKSAGEVFL